MNSNTLEKIIRLILADGMDMDTLDEKIDNWVDCDYIEESDAQWLRNQMHDIILAHK